MNQQSGTTISQVIIWLMSWLPHYDLGLRKLVDDDFVHGTLKLGMKVYNACGAYRGYLTGVGPKGWTFSRYTWEKPIAKDEDLYIQVWHRVSREQWLTRIRARQALNANKMVDPS